ncbi:FAD binding domain-containing protein [Histoplasma capsulatum G186AR]|nr:FAD binding domain-containing protein [Histoplasma capsulatum]QSS73866.1 FAD binding domain-containing protein [Histoplasma capsulatum G186AR]
MVRLASETSPGHFPAREFDDMRCDYGCVFGISKVSSPLPIGSFTSVLRRNNSYGILGGLHGRVYWFHFFKLQNRAYGAGIPRFSKEDESRHIQEHENDILTPNLKFKDLVKGKVACNMTALPEYIVQQWHHNRIITIGDSAHKFHPIAGHGGNSALESSAALTNALVRALKESISNELSTSQISDIFQEVQDLRHKTVKRLIAVSHSQQRLQSLETLFLRFVALHVLPRVHKDRVINNSSESCPPAQRLENVGLPPRITLVPYDSDLLSPPCCRGWYSWVLASFFFALSAVQFWAMDIWAVLARAPGLFEKANVAPFTGIEFLDKILVIPLPRYAAWNMEVTPCFTIVQMYLYFSLFPIVAISTTESCRKRNSLNLLTFFSTSFWAIIYHAFGIAVAAPLHCAAYILTSSNVHYWWPVSRQVPTSYAKTLLPALVLGYLLPPLLSFKGYSGHCIAEAIALTLHRAPIYVNTLLIIFSTVYAMFYPDSHRTPPADKPMPDIPCLNRVYLWSLSVATLVHVLIISTALSPRYLDLSISHIFTPHSSSLQSIFVVFGDIRMLWLAGFWVFWIATAVWCILAVWDMNRVGRARVNLGVAVVVIAMGIAAVGPGAVTAAVWYWREEKMAKVFFSKVEENSRAH